RGWRVTSRLRTRLPARPLPLSLVGARLVEIAPASGSRESQVARSLADLPANPLRVARRGLRDKGRAALGTSATSGHWPSVAPAQITAAFPAAWWITLRPPGPTRSPGHVGHDPAAKWIRGTRSLKSRPAFDTPPRTVARRPSRSRRPRAARLPANAPAQALSSSDATASRSASRPSRTPGPLPPERRRGWPRCTPQRDARCVCTVPADSSCSSCATNSHVPRSPLNHSPEQIREKSVLANLVGDLAASTKPSSEDDGERHAGGASGAASGALQRSRRPRTTESAPRARSPGYRPTRFNEAVVRGRRRAPELEVDDPLPRVASTKPSSEDDGERTRSARRRSRCHRFNEAVVRGRRRGERRPR